MPEKLLQILIVCWTCLGAGGSGELQLPYARSHALLIDVQGFESEVWRPLPDVAGQTDQLEGVLSQHGFDVTRVSNPTCEELEDVMMQFFRGPGSDPEARLLIFFAGHAHQHDGRSWLVPVDAASPQSEAFGERAVSLEWFRYWSDRIRARHVWFVLDVNAAGISR